MNLTEIEKRVKDIEECSGDWEVAHRMENQLFVDFVKYVAHSLADENLSEMAKAVLKVEETSFVRYFA